MAGRISQPPLIVMIENSWAKNSREVAKRRKRAIELAYLQCFGTLWSVGASVLRSDNGLILQSRRVRQACQAFRLAQEFITPYTPEQNGIIERFFGASKKSVSGCMRVRPLRQCGISFGTCVLLV
jgi:putative transposase